MEQRTLYIAKTNIVVDGELQYRLDKKQKINNVSSIV